MCLQTLGALVCLSLWGINTKLSTHPVSLQQELKVLPVHSCGPEQTQKLAAYAPALGIVSVPFHHPCLLGRA